MRQVTAFLTAAVVALLLLAAPASARVQRPSLSTAAAGIVVDARSGDVLHIGKDAARLIEQCDGKTPLREIVGRYPEDWHDRLAKFFVSLFERGLLTTRVQGALEDRGSAGQALAAAAGGGGPALEVRADDGHLARVAESMHLYCQPRM